MTEELRVLVVDDELGMQMGVERSLKGYTTVIDDVDEEVTFSVTRHGSAEDGLAYIKEYGPDILLLDYKLPGMSGLELLDVINKEHPDLLTIMITAYATLETAVSATKRGAFDFLAKPFTPAELKSVVNKAASRLLLIRKAKKLAEEKRQVRFQFISVLAHELKAPLNAIEGYLRLVVNRSVGDDEETYDHMLNRSLVRLDGMRKLIFDLLDMTRIESGQKKREFGQCSLSETIQGVVDMFGLDAASQNITVTVDCDPSIVIEADAGELEIMLNNLISNAIKYNKKDGKVDVWVNERDDKVVVSVVDTGIGMTEKEAAKLFNDFVRIKNEKTSKIMGSGLGLSTVKKLARLYGGDVSVKSEPDAGSTFTLELPKEQTQTDER